ncbi:uncharacterized protein LOC133892136 [Phragmites australis]|uniref:uncharacterized protein LOC133892136 n=1 Tax=Phragmites australis TaxID=29695 RepID=UPI002D79C48F|nr:uncharacterized protein LOC133892136 [Phragmites australis]
MEWQKVLKEMSPLRAAGRFFRHHPLVLCLLLFLVILYKYFFGWFALLVTTSPIFLIAGVFLGIILAYGEPNTPEKDHVYKKIENAHCRNIHGSGKSVGGVSLLRILSSEERVAKHNNSEKKIRKISHGAGSSSGPGSSESGGSDTDTVPILHAFHHLRSASNSSQSSQDGNSNDSSIEDGTENQEGNDGSKREGKEDVKVVAWTADDQKNILKIGCLEIERNQRLESLIARRRVRKYTDRNLIDFGSSDSLPTVEELSKFNVQIPAVFAPRKNPFDLPYNEDNFPESAPSALLEMGNPFDLPHEKANESRSAGGANSSHVEPILGAPKPERSALFRRHESFTAGAPFLSDFWQDTRPSRLRPYFVTEKMANEEITSSSLEGETSEKSNSKASSVQDSDSTSSVTDQESQKDVLENCSNQGQRSLSSQTEEQAHIAHHVREISLALDMEPPVLISDSSDDDISLSGEHINDWEEAQESESFSFSQNTLLGGPSVMQRHQEIDMTRNGLHQMSPYSNDPELTSSSTEATDDPFEVNDIELPAKEVVVTDDTHISDPVYDSSPSGSEKPASIGLVIDEAVLQNGHAHTFDAEASVEEEGSPSRMEASSTEVAAPSLHPVEQRELGEKETSEIREHATFGHYEAQEGSVSHADPSSSDINTQLSTGSPTNGKSY